MREEFCPAVFAEFVSADAVQGGGEHFFSSPSFALANHPEELLRLLPPGNFPGGGPGVHGGPGVGPSGVLGDFHGGSLSSPDGGHSGVPGGSPGGVPGGGPGSVLGFPGGVPGGGQLIVRGLAVEPAAEDIEAIG